MDNIMTVRLQEVGKVSAAVKEPEKLAVALGEAVVVEKGNADYYDAPRLATVYTGSGAPDASLGADGDIYLDLG